ncbi:transposable element Tcb2 transposase [Trichonephila clavipes]|nr:transposable element Tcb2 transposase [Trichonephila clavipes]
MIEAGWSARRATRQLGHSDSVVRRCWDQWIREMSFTRRSGSGRPRQTSYREDRHIIKNARVQPTVSSAAIQVQVAPLLGAPVSSLEPYEGAWLKDFWDRGNHYVSDDNRVRVWRPRGERLNPVFALQRHTALTAGVTGWGAVAYNTRSPLALFRGTITAQGYVHDILQPHVLPLMQRLPGAIFQQENSRTHTARVSQDCLRTVTTLPWLARSPDLSPIKHIWDHLERRVEHPTSFNELETRLQQIWNETSQDIIQNLYASMPDRITSRFRTRGGCNIVRVQYFVRGGSVGHRSRASSKHLSPHLPVDELDSSGRGELWFQQDGATCHTARATIDLLKDTFGYRLISHFGLVNWPPRSCDLTPLDYFLWGYIKSLVYADKPQTLDHLEDNIRRVIADIRPQMLEKVIENWTSRLDYIRASRGSPMPEIIFKM